MTLNRLLKCAFVIGIYLTAKPGSAQDVQIKRIELEQDKLYLYYSLSDTTRGRHYTVNLYSSRDNFINPIQHIRGDAGIEVLPGSNRKIEVNIKDEFGAEFDGKLAFELRAKVYIPFIRLHGFGDFKKFKRGKPYEIQWSGGRPQNVLNFDLYKGDQKVHTFSGIPNGGKYTILFPMDTKPANNYFFRISDSKNKDEVVNTVPFAVKRKVPILLKVIPVFAIAGVASYLTRPKPECEGCLPNFPDPD
jgi:hypothetical protein